MNTFSNSLFTFLFGWARSLIEGVWNAAAEGRLSRFFSWLGDHWVMVVLVLVLIGTALDFLIWFIRWRPYLVWRSTLRRWMRRLRGEKIDSRRRFSRGYQNAVDLDVAPASAFHSAATLWEPPETPSESARQEQTEEESPEYAQPLMEEFVPPPEPGPGALSPEPEIQQDAALPEGRHRRRSEKHGQTWKPAWYPRFSVMDDPDEESMLDGLPPAVDKQQAFHDPVYPSAPPTAWQGQEKNDRTTGA